MEPKTRAVSYTFLALLVSGCAAGSIALQEDNIDQKISASPHIERASSRTYSPRRRESDIEIFYKNWVLPPNAYVDWRTHFQISVGTSPSKPYDAIAEVSHYQRTPYDRLAITAMQQVAANEGGDAIVEVWRSPAIDKATLPAKILGYRYRAIIIRYKETS